MASYQIECPLTLGGSVVSDSPSSVLTQGTVLPRVSDTSELLIKFSVDPMANYKKKKVTDSYLRFPGIKAWTDMLGGSFSWIDSTFSTATTYATQPGGGIILFQYLKKTTTTAMYLFPLKYYEIGNMGYENKPAPRSLFDQLSIGLKIANEGNYPDRQTTNWSHVQDGPTLLDTRFVFICEDWSPTLTARFPFSNAFVNYAVANTFSVGFDAFQSIDYPTVATVTYEVKDLTTSAVTSYNASMTVNLRGRTYIDIPIAANTLVTGNDYQWRAKLVTDDVTTGFSDWANFTTKDATPGLPTIISPQSKYLDGSAAIVLTWQHNVNTGSPQHAYDLDYKQAGSWVSLAAHTISALQSFIVPAGTFTAGTMYWRVRTYNTDNVPGDYGTSAANVVQAKPVTPIIQSITVAPRSTISWQSVGQQAYELTVKDSSGTVVFDTGETYGTAKTAMIDDYLANGNYTFDLTIQNGQGAWSDHAIQTVRIFNSPPSEDDVLTAISLFGAVKLDLFLPEAKGADYVGETYVGESYLAHQPYYASGTRYVLRDGIAIAKITDTTFTDYTAYEEHQYKIRIVTSDGNYLDTNVIIAAPIINYACISKFASPQNVLTLKFNEGEKPKLQNSQAKVINEHYFAGRGLAVQDVTEHYSSVWNLTYSFTRKEDYLALKQLFNDGDTVLFRDNRGYKAIGTLGEISPTMSGKSIVVSFPISETDVSEVIAYD